MINLNEASISKISIHFVGNKLNNGALKLSASSFLMHDEVLNDVLKKYFLHSFKEPYYYHFEGDTNNVWNSINQIFDKPETFHEQSKQLAKLVYDSATHPKIKEGELYIVKFENCYVEDEVVSAIGIFKSENKDTYLKVFPTEENMGITIEEGININKLDKGCLIFETEKEKGYKICIVDQTNKLQEANYWKSDFLGLKHSDTSYYSTLQYMELVKNFSEDFLSGDQQLPKDEQLHFLKKTADYFQEKKTFDIDEFKKDVIIEPEISSAFDDYMVAYAEEKELPVMDRFQISTVAVNKNAGKFFKSVIKLDKNFHLYVHGNSDFIERGFDKEKGLNYYKLYFREEN
jgi:hypothetical protein